MIMITILSVPVAPAGALATSGGGGGKPRNIDLVTDKGYGLLGTVSRILDKADDISTYSLDRH